MKLSIPEKVTALRTKHPVLRYEALAITPVAAGLQLAFTFRLEPSYTFTPSITIPSPDSVVDEHTHRLAFLVGMVELLSYWKLACPARIEIAADYLSPEEITFWEGILRNGLGEFFYLNQVPPSLDLEIVPIHRQPRAPVVASNDRHLERDSYLVLVGGGKDSTVSLELLGALSKQNGFKTSALVVNPIEASLDAIARAGYPTPLTVHRAIDPLLLELNTKGYLNGHTPFSALLAFLSTLVAYRNGFERVVASNESSASEGNVLFQGVEINHQYSKSFEFEKLFQNYMSKLGMPISYLSFLRPLNELQICALFSSLRQHHHLFRSCNREQTRAARQRSTSDIGDTRKTRGWCAECPKCIFTYLCLSCFLPQTEMTAIFGVNPATTPSFVQIARELAGFSHHKPFECVGTFEEVRSCLQHLLATDSFSMLESAELGRLNHDVGQASPTPLRDILLRWNKDHFLDESLAALLKQNLSSVVEGISQ